jgi:hypothetical protein
MNVEETARLIVMLAREKFAAGTGTGVSGV